MKIKFTDKPNHIYIVGGVTPMALINHSGEIVIKEPGGIPGPYPIDGFLFKSESLLVIMDLGIGYEWRLGKTKMFLEPNLQLSLGKFFEEKNISARANGRILLTGFKMGVYI